MTLTVAERIAHLRAHGYILHHLFGNWYLGRIWSTHYRRFSPYWIYHFKDKEIPDRPTSL